VDLLLANSTELAAALDPYSKLTAAAAAAAGGSSRDTGCSRVNTQLRSKDAEGRLWVQFETVAAAEQTLAAAQLVQQLAAKSV
jgi:hypothetical protein